MIFLLKNWRILAILAGVVALAGGLTYAHHHVFQSGVQACENEAAGRAAAAAAAARLNIIKTDEKYEKATQKLAAMGDTGDGVGGRVTAVLDSLYDTPAAPADRRGK